MTFRFSEAGEMAGRVNSFDWATTPLGPLDGWPSSLKANVSLLLACKLPMYIAWGPDFTQIYNDAYAPILGDKHPAALASATPDTWPEIWDTISPMWAKVLEGEAVGFDGFKLTIERFGFPEDVYFNFSYSPVRDDQGLVRGVLVAFAETTQAVLSKRTLESEKEKLHSLFMQAPAAIAVLRGPQMRFELANVPYQKLVSRPAASLIGRPVLEVFPEVDGNVRKILAAVMQGHAFKCEEMAFSLDWNDDGRVYERYLSLIYEPYIGDYGEVEGFIALAFDVTESAAARRRLEAAEAAATSAARALHKADRMKDEFLATLAHELRNPLAPIRQAVMVAQSGKVTPEQLRWSHQVIARQSGHMAVLLDDLLDISRITRGKFSLRPEPVALGAVVDMALETATPLLEARRQQIAVGMPPEPAIVLGDAVRLAQVLSNLLTNASKYSGVTSRIELRAHTDSEHLWIAVRDSGIGIAPEALPTIFDMFSQERTTTDREGGLGVGLALVKGLVELHGGTVEAHSEGRGKGSEFVVCLPLASSQSPAAQGRPHLRPAPAGQPSTILVVDDNRDAAESLSSLLALEGHRVHTALSGRQALEMAQAVRPDVALLDIGMPDMDGYELARRLRAAPWGAKIKLVALTGWGQLEDKMRARDSGFEHHFTKPVDPIAVFELLAEQS